MKIKSALIIVDVQNDFCTGGSLAVPDAEHVIPLANDLQDNFDVIVATKDWHPQDHSSFASNNPGHHQGEIVEVDAMTQILWPDHCVQGSVGAQFHPLLKTTNLSKIIFKGSDKEIDSYSAFFDNAHLRSTGLSEYLLSKQIEDVYIVGLATDYCVKYSSLDAVKLGFNVFVIEDACRGVNLKPDDVANAIAEMQAAGVKVISSWEVKEEINGEQSIL